MVDPGHRPEAPTRPMVARRRSTVRMASRGQSDSADGLEAPPVCLRSPKNGGNAHIVFGFFLTDGRVFGMTMNM